MKVQTAIFCLAITITVNAKLSNGKPQKPALKEMVVIGGDSYYVDMQSNIDWFFADEICRRKNMTLISLQNQAKNDLIFAWLEEYPEYDQFLWSSGMREAGGEWSWTGIGESLTDLNWGKGQPSQPQDKQACVIFSAEPRGWFDEPCENIFFNYMCEFQQAN